MADEQNENVRQEHTISNASLARIYERLNSASRYHPMDTDTFENWTIQAGDKVNVTRDGRSYTSPVMNSRMTWKKGSTVQISATGNKERPSLAKLSQQKFVSGGAAGNSKGGGSGYGSSNYLHWKVQDRYGQMQSGLELTGSYARLYSKGLYDGMESEFRLTKSTITAYTKSIYDGMMGRLEMTASSITRQVNDYYGGLSSTLSATATAIYGMVRDSYNNMSAGFGAMYSSSYLYARSATQAARIFAHAGAAGSQIRLNADRINITASGVTLGGQTTINNGGLKIKNSLMADGSITVIDSNGWVQSPAFITQYNGRFDFYTDDPVSRPLTYSNIGGIYNSVSISNNTLYLETVDGGQVSFKKATTYSGPTWAKYNSTEMGKMTVKAQQNGSDVDGGGFQLFLADSGTKQNSDGTTYSSGDTWYIPVNAKASEYGSSTATGLRVPVNAAPERDNGKNDVSIKEAYWYYDGDYVDQNQRTNNSLYIQTKGQSPVKSVATQNVYLDTGSWSGGERWICARLGGYSSSYRVLAKTKITDPGPPAMSISIDYPSENNTSTTMPQIRVNASRTGWSSSKTFYLYLEKSDGYCYCTTGGFYNSSNPSAYGKILAYKSCQQGNYPHGYDNIWTMEYYKREYYSANDTTIYYWKVGNHKNWQSSGVAIWAHYS